MNLLYVVVVIHGVLACSMDPCHKEHVNIGSSVHS